MRENSQFKRKTIHLAQQCEVDIKRGGYAWRSGEWKREREKITEQERCQRKEEIQRWKHVSMWGGKCYTNAGSVFHFIDGGHTLQRHAG